MSSAGLVCDTSVIDASLEVRYSPAGHLSREGNSYLAHRTNERSLPLGGRIAGGRRTSENTTKAKFTEIAFRELRRFRSCKPVGVERGSLGSSNPRKRSTHP